MAGGGSQAGSRLEAIHEKKAGRGRSVSRVLVVCAALALIVAAFAPWIARALSGYRSEKNQPATAAIVRARAEWFFRQRASANGHIPNALLLRALEQNRTAIEQHKTYLRRAGIEVSANRASAECLDAARSTTYREQYFLRQRFGTRHRRSWPIRATRRATRFMQARRMAVCGSASTRFLETPSRGRRLPTRSRRWRWARLRSYRSRAPVSAATRKAARSWLARANRISRRIICTARACCDLRTADRPGRRIRLSRQLRRKVPTPADRTSQQSRCSRMWRIPCCSRRYKGRITTGAVRCIGSVEIDRRWRDVDSSAAGRCISGCGTVQSGDGCAVRSERRNGQKGIRGTRRSARRLRSKRVVLHPTVQRTVRLTGCGRHMASRHRARQRDKCGFLRAHFTRHFNRHIAGKFRRLGVDRGFDHGIGQSVERAVRKRYRVERFGRKFHRDLSE